MFARYFFIKNYTDVYKIRQIKEEQRKIKEEEAQKKYIKEKIKNIILHANGDETEKLTEALYFISQYQTEIKNTVNQNWKNREER